MRHIFSSLMGAFLGLIPLGCIDEIDLDSKVPQESKLVIDGQLRAGNPSTLLVQVSRSIDFQETPTTNFVGGGSLKIMDDTGAEESVPEIEGGIFMRSFDASSAFEVRAGKAYKMVLELEGKVYESSFDTLYSVPKADSLSIGWERREVLNESENIIEQFFWKVFIHTPLVPENSPTVPNLRWDFTGVYRFVETPPTSPFVEQRSCYVPDKINIEEISILNREEPTTQQLTNYLVMEEPITHKVSSGYLLTVFQQSISDNAFQYWDKARQVISRSGGFLETPPGKIRGNIFQVDDPSEEVLGLFYVSDVDTARILVRARDFPFGVLGFCPSAPTDAEIDETCRNCLLWPNSSYEQPPFWEP
ncbi:MAG: DUF4249 family protein [Bacteroidota bacterium]